MVNLSRILEEAGASIDVSDDFTMADLVVGDERFVFTAPIHFDVTFTNTLGGIVAHGTVTAPATAECSRCLCVFDLTLTGSVEGFFIFPGREEGVPSEQEYRLLHDTSADLMPDLIEALAVEAPFAPVHAEDCPGICPECGKNLTEGPCECPEETPESPFSMLKGMFGKDEAER